jgi:serine/threonine protein kinase
MIYPTISEYKTAVRNAPKTLRTLKDYEPVLRADGEPWFCSGGLAAVFKLRHRVTGQFLALKCFHKYQVDRAETYALISACLGEYPSSYLVHYEYKDNEIWVNSASAGNGGYPLLAMAWAEGVTLGEYVQKCCQANDKAALKKLIEEFDWFAFWLLSQPFAHGDLKPDNIIIRPDGKPILLDYDGMYVPAMKGQDASELGSPVYRHPARTVKDFNKRMDDFSLVILLLELRILAANPQAAGKAGESLYFNPDDIRLSALPGMASYLELDARRHPGSIISGHLLRQLEEMLRQQAAQGSLLLHQTLFQSLKKEPLPQIKPTVSQTGKYLEPDMVLIQGGTFEMGDIKGNGYDIEKPVHKVTLSDYYLARTAVTFEEYDF